MDSSRPTIITQNKFRWGHHERVLKMWKMQPPVHPVSPRYRAIDFFARRGAAGHAERVVGLGDGFGGAVGTLEKSDFTDQPSGWRLDQYPGRRL